MESNTFSFTQQEVMSSCFQASTRIKSSRLYSLVDTLLEEGSVPEFQLFLQKGYLYGFFVLSKVSYIIPQEHTYILWGIFGYLAYQESLRLLISFLLFFPLHVFLKISATMIGMDVYATGYYWYLFLVLSNSFRTIFSAMPYDTSPA